jgi:FkbM family methyltransferase
MSSLQRITKDTVLIPYFIGSAYSENSLKLADVGSRKGYENHWQAFIPCLQVIGFEASLEECEKLNKENKDKFVKHLPYALGEREEEKAFHIYKNAPSSSFFYPNEPLVSRFADKTNLSTNTKVVLKISTLDDILEKENFPEIDFLKMDVEGFELSVLKGAKNALKSNIFGIQLEFSFSELRKDEPLFPEVALFLKDCGFHLFDISAVRLGRGSFFDNPLPKQHGQVVGGHALFFKDVCSKSDDELAISNSMDDAKLLKLACCMELYGLPDCASEVLILAGNKGIIEAEEAQRLVEQIKTKYRKEHNDFAKLRRHIIIFTKKLVKAALRAIGFKF